MTYRIVVAGEVVCRNLYSIDDAAAWIAEYLTAEEQTEAEIEES